MPFGKQSTQLVKNLSAHYTHNQITGCDLMIKKGVELSDHQRSGLSENLAALLSYVFGWITGLIFLLLDKRPYVRFHAAQSIVVFLSLHILRAVLAAAFGMGWWFGGFGNWRVFTLDALLLNFLSLLSLVLWVVLMVKAFQGVRFKLPLAGDFVESLYGLWITPRSLFALW